MSTNRVKWDDTNNRLTAYCSDDTGETELGPIKWDDTNNRLELNCDSTDYTVKWTDATDTLEAQSVGSGCCTGGGTPGGNCCDGIYLTISGVQDCGNYPTLDCTTVNDSYLLSYVYDPWNPHLCTWTGSGNGFTILMTWAKDDLTASLGVRYGGGIIVCAGGIFTITSCSMSISNFTGCHYPQEGYGGSITLS